MLLLPVSTYCGHAFFLGLMKNPDITYCGHAFFLGIMKNPDITDEKSV